MKEDSVALSETEANEEAPNQQVSAGEPFQPEGEPNAPAPSSHSGATVTLIRLAGNKTKHETRSEPSGRPYPGARDWAVAPALPWSQQPDPDAPVAGLPSRYLSSREIARGGQGRILTAFDTELARPVAIKTILAGADASREMIQRFIHEVQTTGQLEHPNIIPVYDVGQLDSGEVFYTMKLVEGRTLSEVLLALVRHNSEIVQEFTRMRLISILQQVCQGIAFAHARGVIHRDLKPSNIMLGRYGEVTVMDWGCALVKRRPHSGNEQGVLSVLTSQFSIESLNDVGDVQGTPAYMSPEQAEGDIRLIDERSDVYALGAILYEMLTYRPPIEGGDVAARLEAAKHQPVVPPRQRAAELDIPQELEDLCLKCLAKQADERFNSALDLHAALEAYLEGTLDRERRVKEAGRIVEHGQQVASSYDKLCREAEKQRMEIRSLRLEIEPWESIERKKKFWRANRRLEQLETQCISVFGEAVKIFNQALSHDSGSRDARANLAALYWSRYEDAELRRDRNDMLYFETLVREFDDGRYEDALRGDGLLTVLSSPPDGRVILYQLREVDYRLRMMNRRDLGTTPLFDVRLVRGSYLVTVESEAYRESRVPVFVERQSALRVELKLLSSDQLIPDCIYIPAGYFTSGGDPAAPESNERQRQYVPDFLISRYPVTCRQYLEFLNAIAETDLKKALRHCPRYGDAQESYYWTCDEQGRFLLPRHDKNGRPWDPRWPVFGVSWEDAHAYCVWRMEVEGREVRLPGDLEWEKAGRGGDGRYFPWGDQFDPTFCKMRDSRQTPAQIEAVGVFDADESLYGVRDLAGCISEWSQDWYNRERGLKLVKGGAWNSIASQCRLACRHGEYLRDVFISVGFRTVRPLEAGASLA